MQKSASSSRKQQNVIFPAFVSIAAGEIVAVVLSLVFSFVFSIADLPKTVINVMVLLALAVGALVTGHLCAKLFPRERGLMALICGLTMAILLVLLNLIFFQDPITLLSFGKYGVILAGAFLGAALTNPNIKRKNKKKLKKY